MPKEEIKKEIISVLDSFSDKALTELLSFLKEVDFKKNEVNSSRLLYKILSEDKDLLSKLSQ